MAKKRRYHVAFLRPDNTKFWTVDLSLAEAVSFAQELSDSYHSRAKSTHEWHMPSGLRIAVERSEDVRGRSLSAISVFENEDYADMYDLRNFSSTELARLAYADEGDFINRYVSKSDPEAYGYIVSTLFSVQNTQTVEEFRKTIQDYIKSRPADYYQILLTEQQYADIKDKDIE